MAEREGRREVEEGARGTEREGRRAVPQERPDQRQVGAREEPGVQGLSAQEPVGAELRDAREEIDHPELRAEEPHRPPGGGGAREGGVAARVEGERSARGEHHQPRGEDRDQVVVVEVEGLVDQLDVGEEREEDRRAPAGAPAEREAEGRGAHQREDRVHPRAAERAHAREAQVGEMVRGRDVELGDPSPRGEARHRREHHGAEEGPEGREGGDVDGFVEARAQAHDRALSRRRCR
ncbi:MAG: hypothetical protein R3A52_18180 [Polyangiales bacterium]